MYKQSLLTSFVITVALTLAACSDNEDTPPASTSSQFNPNAEPAIDDGKGGGDTTAIAGLWDGTVTEGETSDVVYWLLSDKGVLTRYDYQQDGVASANGENCYVVGDPISVDPEDGDTYSFFNVATTAVVSDQQLTITFIDADINDLNNNGDTSETPTLTWTLLETPSVEDLNSCTVEDSENADTPQTDSAESVPTDSNQTVSVETANPPGPPGPPETEGAGGAEAPPVDVVIVNENPFPADGDSDGGGIPVDTSDTPRPQMTRAECKAEGGKVIGDIGNGAIHRPEYRCESGNPPIASIRFLEGEPIATEGEVCCL